MPANESAAAGSGAHARGGNSGRWVGGAQSLASAVGQIIAQAHDIASARVTLAQRLGGWRSLKFAVLLLPLAQVAVMLYVITSRSSMSVFWDERWNVPIVEHANAGTLSFHDFWQLHNDSHRIVIPRMIDLVIIQMTHWNEPALMLVNVISGVASAALIFLVMRRTLGSLNQTLLLAVPASLLLFSLAFWGDWFVAFQITYFLTVFGIALTLWTFDARPLSSRWFWLGVAGAMIATLSSFAGLAAWLVFLPRVYQAGRRRLIAWGVIGTVITAAYLYHYPHPGGHHDLGYLLQMGLFFLAYLGAPLGYPTVSLCLAFGVLAMLFMGANLYLAWRIRVPLDKLWVWVELALFALATDAFTTLGRAYTGVIEATPTRYIIFPVLWWLAAVVIAALVMQQALRRWRSGESRGIDRRIALVLLANGLAVLLICVASVTTSVAGLRDAFIWEDALQAHQSCMMHPATASDACLEFFLPVEWKGMILPEITYLQEHHYALYYTAAPTTSGTATGVATNAATGATR